MPPMTPEQQAAAMAAAHQFIVEEFTLLGIAIVFVILRTWTRLSVVGIKGFQLDDYAMIFAIILFGLESGAAYMVVNWYHGFANSGMTPAERAALSPESPEYQMRVNGSKVQVTGWSLYTLLLWTIKLCLCCFYGRLTAGVSHMKMRVNIGYALIGVTYAATILSILLGCRPLHKNWQINPDPGNACQPAISTINCVATVVLNVLTDLYLIAIPVPMLWKTQIKLLQKILLIAMFSGGIFVIACGILRAVLILTDPVSGAQQAGSWAVRETFVSIIVANLPIVYQKVRPWFLSFYRGARRTVTGASTYQQTKDKDSLHPYGSAHPASELSTFKNGSRASKKNKFVHPLSLRNATMSGSEEYLNEGDEKSVGITKEVIVEETEVHSQGSGDDSRSRRQNDFVFAGGQAVGYEPHHPSSEFTPDTSGRR